jgi:hypothetical protein
VEGVLKVWELLRGVDIDTLVEAAKMYVPKWAYAESAAMESLISEISSCTVACSPGGGSSGVLRHDAIENHALVPELKWVDGSKGPSGMDVLRRTDNLYRSEWLGLDIDDKLLWAHGEARLCVIILWWMTNDEASFP